MNDKADGLKKATVAVIAAIVGAIVIVIVTIYFMFNWFLCTISFGLFMSESCKNTTAVTAITDKDITKFGEHMKDARDNVKADVKGDLYRDLPVPNQYDKNGDSVTMNEAEIHIRALMQTDEWALSGIDLSDKALEGDAYKGTNLEKSWKLAKIWKANLGGIKKYAHFTNSDWIMKARLDVYTCYMVGNDSAVSVFFGTGSAPCKEINAIVPDMIPEANQAMLTHTHDIIEIREVCIPRPVVVNDKASTTSSSKKATLELAHHTDRTVHYPYEGTCDGTIETTTTKTTYVTYQNLTYDVLFAFEPYSLMKPGVTIPEKDSYKTWIIYYLKELYNQNLGSDSYMFTPGGGLFIAPMQSGTYVYNDSFGWRVHPITGVRKHHNGIDLSARLYTPIYASADGVVMNAGRRPDGSEVSGFGNTIVINHGDYKTLYGHVESDGILVKVGDTVKQGQLIGGVGNQGASTGPHLHFEICPTDQGSAWSCDNQLDPNDPKFGIIFDKSGNNSGAAKAISDVFQKGKAEFLANGKQELMMPGFTAMAQVLGSWVSQFESGSKGAATIGWDSTGGWSYGTFQLAEKQGSVQAFANWLGSNGGGDYYDALSPIDPSSESFRDRWVTLALKDPNGFTAIQYKYIQAQYYDVSRRSLMNMSFSFDPSTRARSVQEMIWSMSVQHGPAGPRKFFETVYINKGIDPNNKTDADIISDIFAERMKVNIYFSSSTTAVQEAVYNRFVAERKLLLDKLFSS